MAVTAKFDKSIRRRLSEKYRSAGDFVRLGSPYADGYWTWEIAEGSDAFRDEPITLGLRHTFVAALDFLSRREDAGRSSAGVRLPLSQTRELLVLAAGGIQAVAELTSRTAAKDEVVRRASIGAVARASLEHSATAVWVLAGEDRDERLARALLLEISGVEQLIKYFFEARAGSGIDDLLWARDAYVKVAMEDLGAEVDLERIPKIDGMQVPKKTELIEQAIGRNPYPELSSFAHPNPFHGSTLESSSGGREGQFVTVGGSTIHTEARLVEPTLLSFGVALAMVARYVGSEQAEGIVPWLESCVDIWSEWCGENGCGDNAQTDE